MYSLSRNWTRSAHTLSQSLPPYLSRRHLRRATNLNPWLLLEFSLSSSWLADTSSAVSRQITVSYRIKQYTYVLNSVEMVRVIWWCSPYPVPSEWQCHRRYLGWAFCILIVMGSYLRLIFFGTEYTHTPLTCHVRASLGQLHASWYSILFPRKTAQRPSLSTSVITIVTLKKS